MSLRELVSVLPPPATAVEAIRTDAWPAIELQLGLKLPPDYCSYLEAFGTGSVDNFVWPLNPVSANLSLNFASQARVWGDAFREIRAKHPDEVPFQVHPEPGGLLVWAFTDNGDTFSWLTEGAPSEWPIVVLQARTPAQARYATNATTFLARVLDRSLLCPLFPPDFPSSAPRFAPVGTPTTPML